MMRYVIVSVVSGVLFGTMDGLINGNPFAQRILSVYKPIMRTRLNVPAGIVIDLVYGFVMAALFILLYHSLPGPTGVAKGAAFALLAWFFRVAMYAASQWMMFRVPAAAVLYMLLTGLAEMLALGMLYGLALGPAG